MISLSVYISVIYHSDPLIEIYFTVSLECTNDRYHWIFRDL